MPVDPEIWLAEKRGQQPIDPELWLAQKRQGVPDTMTLESLMGAAPQAEMQPGRLSERFPFLTPTPNPEEEMLIQLLNFGKGAGQLVTELPQFFVKDLPEALAATITRSGKPGIGTMVKEMTKDTAKVIAATAMRQLNPEEYERWKQTPEGQEVVKMIYEEPLRPIMAPLIFSGAMRGLGKKFKKAPTPRLKAKPKGEPLEPILEEVLGFEKPGVESSALEAAKVFEREMGITEQLKKSPREAELLKRRLKAGKTLVPTVDELLGAEKAKVTEPVTAVRLESGKIISDPTARTHAELITNKKIPAENVADGGFIVRGRYKEGSADAVGIGRQAKAKVAVARKRAERLSKPAVAKESWEMNVEEYGKQFKATGTTKVGGKPHVRLEKAGEYYDHVEGANKTQAISGLHKFIIEKALSENKPVPAEVLKDYPELQITPKVARKPWEHAQVALLDDARILREQGKIKIAERHEQLAKALSDPSRREQIIRDNVDKFKSKYDIYGEGPTYIEGYLAKSKAPPPKGAKVEVVETPKEAVAEIIEGKRESTIGTAEFKKKMLAELDRAIEKHPDYSSYQKMIENLGEAKVNKMTMKDFDNPKIEIKIPGDGEFVINNDLPKLIATRKKVARLSDAEFPKKKGYDWGADRKPYDPAYAPEGYKPKGLKEAMEAGEVTFEPAKGKKPSERGALLNIPREIARPGGAEPVKYKEAIKTPDRPEMTNMESYYKSISAPEDIARPPIPTPKEARLQFKTFVKSKGIEWKNITKHPRYAELKTEFAQSKQRVTITKAQEAGIALRQTSTGKIKPAVREAGTFVPAEFATYEGFKDAKAGVFGGTKDWIRYVQEIGGAKTLQEKSRLPGQADPAEKFILRRTEDIVKLELDWSAEQSLRIQKITEGLNKNQERLVTEVLEETSRPGAYVETSDFATNSRIKKITTDTKIVKAAQEARKLLEHMLSDQNKNRALRGQGLINYREYYAPHILREASLWERAFGSQFKPKEVVQGPGLPDYIKPNKPFNPRELAREVGLKDFMREMRIGKILEDYANTASRDIHHTSIIQNNKAFIQQLETMGYKNAAEGLSNYTAESFGGVKPWLDRGANLPQWMMKGMRFWRGSLMRSVFPLNFTWNTFVQTFSSGLTVMRSGITNSTRGIADWFTNPAMRNRIKSAYSFRVKSQRAGRITHQDINTGLTKMISGKRSTWQAAIDGTNYLTELVERELTGWSIASGLRHGAKRGLKGKALWDYASDMGAKTQSMYNMENKPGIIRSEIVQTAKPFQTFIFEMYNTAKEFAGKTGTPPGAMTERIGWVLRFMAMAYAGNEISHAITGRRPWEIYSFIPFSDETIKPIVNALRGKPYDAISGRGLPSFVGAGVQFARAVRSYLRYGDTRKLRQWGIKYGTAFMKIPGGTQVARMVDGWIAVADGKMKDARGKTLFTIKDPWEQVRAVSMGPWRTKAGIEYWDKRETGILEDIGIVKPKKKLLSPWEVMGGVGKSKKRKKGVDFSKYLGAQ